MCLNMFIMCWDAPASEKRRNKVAISSPQFHGVLIYFLLSEILGHINSSFVLTTNRWFPIKRCNDFNV